MTASNWTRAFDHFVLKVQSWALLFSGMDFEIYQLAKIEDPVCGRGIVRCRKVRDGSANGMVNVIPRKQHKKERKSLVYQEGSLRLISNGKSRIASLFTQKGEKGINQDAMIVLENFLQGDTVFCGVFDGHGQDGHLVARNVRDLLPRILALCWKSSIQAYKQSIPSASSSDDETDQLSSSDDSETDSCSLVGEGGDLVDANGDPDLIMLWKVLIVNAYRMMDRELLMNKNLDCISSGTTAVTVIRQGNDLIIGNVGDSRAVLGTRNEDDSFLALQLTVDLKPDVPREAERIRRFKGRVFAVKSEPSVRRVWLPNRNAPGLAMARSFGDYCLKNHGVISEPEVTYRRLGKKDEFVVLATDGVWDVLSNQQVVDIVASAADKSLAARIVVDTAVHQWRSKHATSSVDDCAVVCLFLKDGMFSCQ